MKIIENSSIVDLDKYPEYICAIVMTKSVDIKTTKGFLCAMSVIENFKDGDL